MISNFVTRQNYLQEEDFVSHKWKVESSNWNQGGAMFDLMALPSVKKVMKGHIWKRKKIKQRKQELMKRIL